MHKDFYGQGLSSVNTSSLLTGRPHGGLAILCRKSLDVSCKINTYDDKCHMGIEFTDGRKMKYLLLNVYVPYESYENYDSFLYYRGKIASIFSSSANNFVYAIGDYNAHIKSGDNNEKKNSRKFGFELVSVCEDNGFVISDMVFLANKKDPFTFLVKYIILHHGWTILWAMK